MTYIFCLMCAFLLSACDSVKSTLGLNHDQPDEFLVSTNPPLELPPNYTLRPPKAGQEGHVNTKTSEQKAKDVLGTQVTSSKTSSSDVLSKAASSTGTQVDPDIRATLEKEAAPAA